MNLTTTSVPKKLEKKVLNVIKMKKQLEEYEKDIKQEIFYAMKDNDITQIKTDKYTFSIVNKINFKTDDITQVDTKCTKVVLDNNKCSQYLGLYGMTPKNVRKEETQYLMWRSK